MTPPLPPELTTRIGALYQELSQRRRTPAEVTTNPAFREFVSLYVATFWNRSGSMIREKTRCLTADDLSAVASLALIDALLRYDPTRGTALVEWLRLAMYQACHQHVRANYAAGRGTCWLDHQSSASSAIMLVQLDGDTTAHAGLHASGEGEPFDPQRTLERQVIRDAVAGLQHPYNVIVRARYFEGCTFEEIGVLIQGERPTPVHKGTVKRLFDRGLGYLREALQGLL